MKRILYLIPLLTLISCEARYAPSIELTSFVDEDSCLGDYEFCKDIDTTLLDENARQEYRETLYYESLPDTIQVTVPGWSYEVTAEKNGCFYAYSTAYGETWWFDVSGKLYEHKSGLQ